ncbi:uncharacterized protein LOC113211797 [Frankliniella occidentalis]|uniref:Uncharacterized protein LOC113211797 n=1 Tax=Frankliniella occidentalis TaxID=133901 RepID=A0A9C6UDM1_FRAOC|nr:uncharacterized protein LOC113211797 [Frankliniella occidentalis]
MPQDGVVSLLPADLSRTRRWSRKYPISIVASEKLGEEENVLAPTTPSTSSSVAPAEQGAQSPPPAAAAASALDLPSIMVSAASTPLASFEDFPAGSQEGSARTSVDSAASATVKISPTTSATSPPVSHKDSPRASSTSLPTVTVPAASALVMSTAATSANSSKDVPASASKQPRMSRSSGSDVSDLSVNFADVTKVCDVEDVEERLLGGIMSQEIIGLVDDDVAVDEIGPASMASTIGVQGTSLLLLARTARQKEEWFRRLRRATGEPHPLDDAAFLEDYVASLQHYLDDEGEVAEDAGEVGADPAAYQGLNALAGRVLFDACHSARWAAAVQEHVQKRMASVRVPAYMERPVVSAVRCRHAAVKVLRAGRPRLDAQGLWVDLDVSYRGVMQLVVTSRLNLTSQQQQQQQAQQAKPPPSTAPINLDGNGVEDQVAEEVEQLPPTLPPMLQQRTGTWGIFKRLAESRFFQAALLALSNTDIVLVVEVRALDGVLCVHVPPPPSDGVWLGFRGVPCLRLAAVPRVGSRTLRHALLCRLIERRLRAHMERVLVLPNMVNMLLPFT